MKMIKFIRNLPYPGTSATECEFPEEMKEALEKKGWSVKKTTASNSNGQTESSDAHANTSTVSKGKHSSQKDTEE